MNSIKYKELSPEDLNHWIEGKRSFYLIDTLPDDHFSKIHLPGAVNASVFQITFMDQVKAITEDGQAVGGFKRVSGTSTRDD